MEFGNVRMGGRVPKEMYYSFEKDEFYESKKCKTLSIPARQSIFVDIEFKSKLIYNLPLLLFN